MILPRKNTDIKSDSIINISSRIVFNNAEFNKIPVTKKYFSEAILITDTDNIFNIVDWLYWHINVIGFDHIIVIDNDSPVDIKPACDLFQDKVDYYKFSGFISQMDIYTNFVNKSNAEWVLPIDDDEFLYLSNTYSSINDFIKENIAKLNVYKFAINWICMFSNNLLEHHNYKNSYIEDFTYSYNGEQGFPEYLGLIKTLVNTNIYHLYISENADEFNTNFNELDFVKTIEKYDSSLFDFILKSKWDRIGSVHNPVSKNDNIYECAYDTELQQFYFGMFNKSYCNYNGDIYLAHYKFRSLDEWLFKINNRKRFPSNSKKYYDTIQIEDTIYAAYSYNKFFKENNNLINKYNQHKNTILKLKSNVNP